MDKNAIAIIEAGKETLTAVQVRAQVNLIQEVMKSVMKKDTHFGVVPGCKKPSLYKAGSEVLLTTFRLAVDPEVTDLSTNDEFRFRVRVRITTIADGKFVGTGIGEASTGEEKHMWRKAVCEEEFNETPEDRRRIKWAVSFETKKPYSTKQVRTNPKDLANTALKMAKKRAQIDGVLTCTAASDIFTQDIEDLPEEVREEVGDGEQVANNNKPKVAPSTSKSSNDVATGDPSKAIECECGAVISEKVAKYSMDKFKRHLCYECQKKAK